MPIGTGMWHDYVIAAILCHIEGPCSPTTFPNTGQQSMFKKTKLRAKCLLQFFLSQLLFQHSKAYGIPKSNLHIKHFVH